MTDSESPNPSRSPNVALQRRMAHKGYTKAKLSQETGVSERAIGQWLAGINTPQHDYALRVAAALDCQPGDLWPDKFPATPAPVSGQVPVPVYESRADVPIRSWTEMFATAEHQIDICVYGGTFLFDTVPGFNRLLKDATTRGVIVRFLVGDPGGANIVKRGTEERVRDSLQARCQLTLDRLAPIAHLEGIRIRTHGTPLYVSMFRSDETLLANHHIFGSPASDNPVLSISQAGVPGLFEKYAESFDRIWDEARGIPAPGGTP